MLLYIATRWVCDYVRRCDRGALSCRERELSRGDGTSDRISTLSSILSVDVCYVFPTAILYSESASRIAKGGRLNLTPLTSGFGPIVIRIWTRRYDSSSNTTRQTTSIRQDGQTNCKPQLACTAFRQVSCEVALPSCCAVAC